MDTTSAKRSSADGKDNAMLYITGVICHQLTSS